MNRVPSFARIALLSVLAVLSCAATFAQQPADAVTTQASSLVELFQSLGGEDAAVK